MKLLTLALAFMLAIGLIACSSSDTSSTADEAAETAGQAAETAAETATDGGAQVAATHAMEVACGSCVYKMAGVQGCTAATKVNGKPMVITGMQIDAHGLGLCSGPKTVKMAGHAHGDSYHATAFEME